MTTPSLKDRIQEDMKAALRAQEKDRLGALRLIVAALKQREIDERIILDDAQTVSVLEKMIKQRRESLTQYLSAGRDDLATREQFEISVIQAYLPAQLSDPEISDLIAAAIQEAGAASLRDMGKVMAILKPKLQGRADMGAVSQRIREKLGSA